MKSKWNEDQLKAIESVDNNTLVSASAGSGKTAVTIERIIRIIKNKTAPVKRIVMLAFSNAVAAELKERISQELIKAMREDGADKEYLREQIDDVSMADISTVHSFCGNLVKEFFEEAEVDPSYAILEPAEREGMLDKAVDTVLKSYGEAADPTVSSLKFTFGTDKEFRSQIKRTYGFLEAQPDRQKWLDGAFSGYALSDDAAKELLSDTRKRVKDLSLAARRIAEKLAEYPGFDKENRVKLTLIADGCDAALKAEDGAFIDELSKTDLAFTAGRKMAKAAIISAAAEAGADTGSAELVYGELKTAQKAFASRCSAVAKSTEKLRAYSLAEWREYGDKVKPYVEKFAEIVGKVADEYRVEKQSENKMDFADLEYYAIKILKNDEIAQEIRSRYDFVCIDEYQDTNYVQEYVLSRISNGRNLFMVGDVKQSIYQFRLTETEIFLDKLERYGSDPSEGNTVTLNKNYRSDKRILDFVNEIFSKLMTKENGGVDYAATSMLDTDLKPSADGLPVVRIRPVPKKKSKPRQAFAEDGVYSVKEDVPLAEDAGLEAQYIAEQIASLVGKRDIVYYENNEPKRRKIRYGDITLLCATRSARVQSIIEYLRSVEIPLASANVSYRSDDKSVNMLLNLLRVIDNPMQDVALVAVMKSVFGGFDCSELAKIRKEYQKEEFFYRCADLYASEKDDGIAQKLRGFFAGIQQLRDKSAQVTAGKLLEDAVAKFSFDKYVVAHFGKEDCEHMRAFIAGLAEKSYAVTLQSMLSYGEDVSLAGENAEKPEDEDCVQTSTVHASKGLEYPVVFLMDASASFGRNNRSADVLLDKDFGIAMKYPEEETRLKRYTLKYLACDNRLTKKYLEERLRLFYVALTRAKNLLYITGEAEKFGEAEKTEPSFMNWLNNVCVADPSFYDRYVDGSELTFVGGEDDARRELLTFAVPDEKKLKEIRGYLGYRYPYENSTKTGIKHTVTGINKENPDDYGTTYVSNWFEEDSAETGTAYHKVMENVDYDSPSVDAVAKQIREMYDKGILDEISLKAVDPDVVFRCLCSDIIIKARARAHMREKQFMLRVSAKDVLDGGVEDKILIQGTIDLLIPDYDKKTATVVDFKMSKLPSEIVAKRYRKQLELYALAAENGLGLRVDKKIIYILDKDVILEV